MYRIALTYHPDIPSFRKGRRGAWRVAACQERGGPLPRPSVVEFPLEGLNGPWVKWLLLDSPTPRRVGDWCNPLKVVKEHLAVRALECVNPAVEPERWLRAPSRLLDWRSPRWMIENGHGADMMIRIRQWSHRAHA